MLNCLSANSRLSKISEPIITVCLGLLILLLSTLVYFYDYTIITGPISWDEFLYLKFTRALAHGNSLAPYTQYGPLYPAIIAPFFLFKSLISTYQAIKIMNIIFFLSSIIPAYLFAHRLFIHPWLKKLLPFLAIITPLSGAVHMIWAEPLYVPLFYWACFLLYCHIQSPNKTNSLWLSIFLSALYYAKPPSGLIMQIAGSLVLLLFFIHSKQKLTLFTLFFSWTLDSPWMLHYIHLHCSIVGYPAATIGLSSHIAELGRFTFFWQLMYSFFAQFSYIFVSTWGLIAILAAIFIQQWRRMNNAEFYLTLFILISLIGLMALSAIGVCSMPETNYHMVQGRYFIVLSPIIIALTLHFKNTYLLYNPAQRTKQQMTLFYSSEKVILIIIFLSTLITLLASPLYTFHWIAFNSMPDISFIIFMHDHGYFQYHPLSIDPPLLLRIIVPIFFGLLALYVALAKKIYWAILLIAAGSLFSTYTTHAEMLQYSSRYTAENNLDRFILTHHFNIKQIALDARIPRINQPPSDFWFDEYLVPTLQEKIMHNPQIIYFITTENPLPGWTKIHNVDNKIAIYKIH